MGPNPTKAAHYVQLLDAARCDGDWDAVPELVRKIKKHAPQRNCLALTAEVELAIEQATKTLTPSARPATSITAHDLDLPSLLPKLLSASEAESQFPEDRFQAQVCVGWLHWVGGEYSLAHVRLPKSSDLDATLAEAGALSDWTRLCALKSAYLRANSLVRNGKRLDALAVFEEGLPCLTRAHSTQQSRKQLRYWSELFLTEYCWLFSKTVQDGEAALDSPNSLASFRSWARYWEGGKGAPLAGGHGFRGSVPRRKIWFEYYSALSSILEQDLPFPTGYVPSISNESSARNQLRMELKRVEVTYEALLLGETEFPRADEEREEVETFIALVMLNWAILKGRGWREQDLGQGGKESLSRGVLDILYRASMKTYHSTAILRHLFTVHLAVAEFDLAFKAFDSYFSLIKKGKARVAGSGHQEPSLDDDATVLETMSLCIAALCRYGAKGAAERARDLSRELEQSIGKLGRTAAEPEDIASSLQEGRLLLTDGDQDFPPRVIAIAWQSVGLAHAQWTRMTSDSASRTEIQAKAVKCLRKSLSVEYGRSASLRGIFALGLLLAEQRELTAAIELVKTSLLSNKAPGGRQDLFNGPYWKERSLIPLWHLLALLLSARQDYVMAARACEGAFEQFRDPSVLFGSEQLYRSDHLNEADVDDEKGFEDGRGLVDEMDDFEKESIIEVKMTQLALVELLEGPRIAVNASLELLSLFTRLFGNWQIKAPAPPKTAEVPKSSAGTLRSIKGSIFGRAQDKAGRPATKHSSLTGTEKLGPVSSRPQTMQTTASSQPPAIQVTRENGSVEEARRSRKSGSHSEKRSQSHKRSSLRKRESSGSGSRRRALSSGGEPHRPTVLDGENYFTPFGEGPDFFQSGSSRQQSSHASNRPPVSISRQISQVESITSTISRASEVTEIAVDGIEPTASLMPLIQFPKEYEKRRRSTILVRVWLMIAGFYRRANMFDDAKGATGEAQKLVQSIEAEVARDASGSVLLRKPGWAGMKSVDELWGDVWAELGFLAVAKEEPYTARSDFESALTHFPDHAPAIVGLSNILLDIYSEKLLPSPAIPALHLAGSPTQATRTSNSTVSIDGAEPGNHDPSSPLPREPLGLVTSKPKKNLQKDSRFDAIEPGSSEESELPPPYKAASIPLVDRLAARDRAYSLLSGLTKLGSAWNYPEAWFALARAHEESGQLDKAKEVLWWCVELEESMGVRDWSCVSTGGYVL